MIPVSNNGLKLIFGSGANGENPYINYRLRKKHYISEFKDREKKFGHKERDTLKGFYNLRKEIIFNYNSSISNSVIDELALRTRGLIKKDIEIQVEKYISDGVFPSMLVDKTNTCDPLTGNWDEHLMDKYHLAKILELNGFKTIVLSGKWRGGKNYFSRLVKILLNFFIIILVKIGYIFSP